ncbi:TraY domain-containing protein (plasmid) [Photobacterium damselae subsp. damselae]|uniref:TraY domain-containing protein n=1 Tax=Photobacterium damselae TaxID=38293 RepID=UPI00311ABFF5
MNNQHEHETERKVALELDLKTRNLLNIAAQASGRTLKSEASIRVNDHLTHFLNAARLPIISGDKHNVIVLSAASNHLLEMDMKQLAKGSSFARVTNKANECNWRLRDHLNKVEYIATIGKRFLRDDK